ncbi:response regulator receiver protein (plasmid) [Thalassoporum mexicanum PCC 7367]|nr:response regulator receiver protein [Pseudanabaena sp. PCC 7367]
MINLPTLWKEECMTKKILIAEDKPDSLRLFRDILNGIGYLDLIEIDNGQAVFDQARQHKPDFIIMDIQLPGISGIDAIQQIKQDENLKNIPILATSAFCMEHDLKLIKNSGCDDFIAKPFNVADFIQVIKKWLEQDC